MASVWIDVDLDEVSTSDLLEELENRYLGEREQKELIELLRCDDKIKFDLFLKIKDRYTILEFEELFKEKSNFPIPKEQLNLFTEPLNV